MSSPCAVANIRRFLPDLKIITILRDPIKRSVSRFREQSQTWIKKPDSKASQYIINNRLEIPGPMKWEEFVDYRLPFLKRCLQKCNQNDILARANCAYRDNVIGWSVYAPSIKLWERSFGSSEVLILYNEDLEENPESVMKSIEAHLGLKPHGYRDLSEHFNTAGCYGWKKDRNHEQGCEKKKIPVRSTDHTTTTLAKFFIESVNELREMAKEGLVPAPPLSWLN